MGRQFSLEPRNVKLVDTKYRKIKTQIPNPESTSLVRRMRTCEPVSMSGQPVIVWDAAKGCQVYDKSGNCWIDFSSGVVVTNAGHCNPEVQKAILETVELGLLLSYCFPTEQRGRLEMRISELVPIPDNRVFLLTTGAESTECAIKLARTYGALKSDTKIKIVTFEDAFHGRTMGSQQAGGSPAGKAWIKNLDKDILQVPFPNAFKYQWADEKDEDYSDDRCFAMFLKSLEDAGVNPKEIAGVMTETFQGGWCQLMPKGFVQRLRKFCTEHDILLIFDEVQAGFGRTGKMFGFLHAEVTPDLICCGKGISSSLPLSCVVGRSDVMNLYGPNQMTSTHTGNPVCSAAALASMNYIVGHGLVENAAKMGEVCEKKLREIQRRYPDHIGFVCGVGLAWAVIFTKPGTKEMDCETACDVVERSFEKGLLFFAPVGSGATIKVCPPLMISEEILREGLDTFEEAVSEVLG